MLVDRSSKSIPLAVVALMLLALIPGVVVVSSAPEAEAQTAPADVTIVAQNLDRSHDRRLHVPGERGQRWAARR